MGGVLVPGLAAVYSAHAQQAAKPTGIPVLRDLLPPALDTRVVNPLVSYAGSRERVLSGCALLQFTPVAINAIPCGASRGLHLMPCWVKLCPNTIIIRH